MKPKYKVGDRVHTHNDKIKTVTAVHYSLAYELDHLPFLYQPDEVFGKVRDKGSRRVARKTANKRRKAAH
jgi:hypothetical protein